MLFDAGIMDVDKQIASSIGSVGRSMFSRALSRRDSNLDVTDDLKGSLGLSTLYIPSGDAVADLVFVHGLGGGSRSTWTKSGDPSLYWPQLWLPEDVGFQDVRIHVFGYDSNWNKESTLNIHDFAKSLLNSLQDCPNIPRFSQVSTAFLSWSLIVVKLKPTLSKFSCCPCIIFQLHSLIKLYLFSQQISDRAS